MFIQKSQIIPQPQFILTSVSFLRYSERNLKRGIFTFTQFRKGIEILLICTRYV